MRGRLDWELSPAELIARMSKWVDKTLLQRLEMFDYHHYKERYRALIQMGRYKIPPKTRAKLERKYARLVQEYAKQMQKAPIHALPTVTGAWYELGKWLLKRQKNKPELNVDFSFTKLTTHGMKYVWEGGSKLVFTDKQLTGPPSKARPQTGQYVVYEISIYTTSINGGEPSYVESFLQASQSLILGADPTSEQAHREAKIQVGEFEERNQMVINGMYNNRYMYNWNKPPQEGVIKYLGIGVKL